MKRNSMLDILKGLCIIFIILDHFTGWNSIRLNYLFPYWITMAVPMLMIILGYQYANSYQRHQIKTLKDSYSFFFILDKIIRYSIPFVMAYALEFLISSLSNGPKAILLPWLRDFFLGGWGPGSYYYPILLQFIFVFPIIYFLIERHASFGLLICTGLNILYELFQYAVHLNYAVYRLLIFRYILLIAFGCYLFLYKKSFKWPISIASLIIGAFFIWLFSYTTYQPIILVHWSQTCFLTALFILPIAGFLLRSNKMMALSFPPLELIGKASYNIFLVQMVYFNYVAHRIYQHVPSMLLCVIINLAITVLAGSIFYFFERKITSTCINTLHTYIRS